jgi:hypothetical protein
MLNPVNISGAGAVPVACLTAQQRFKRCPAPPSPMLSDAQGSNNRTNDNDYQCNL